MYLTIILISLVIISIYEVVTSNPQNRWLIIYVILFFLLASLRWERGTDWHSYYSLYNNFQLFGENAFEFTYMILNILFAHVFNLNYSIFLTFQATIIYILLYKAIKKEFCRYPVFALLCLYVTVGTGVIFFTRQMIAVIIIFYSFKYVKRRQLKNFLVCMVCAMCFHRASLIALPVYFIYSNRFTTKNVIQIIGVVIVFGIIERFGIFDILWNKFIAYEESGHSTFTQSQFYLGVIKRLGYFFIFFFLIPKRNVANEQREYYIAYKGLFRIYCYSIFIYLLGGTINITLARLSSFIDVFSVYQMYYLVCLYKSSRMTVMTILVLMLITQSSFSSTEYLDFIVPYKSIFNKDLPVSIG